MSVLLAFYPFLYVYKRKYTFKFRLLEMSSRTLRSNPRTMSFHHNQVQLTGRVAADPELFFTTDGTPKVSLALLQDRPARQSDTPPERFNLVAWAAIGRRLHETLRQDDRLFIQGRLRTRSFSRE